MRTRSQARKRRQQQVRQTSIESPNLEKPNNNQETFNPPIVTMADNRTMAQLLEAPTEGHDQEDPQLTSDISTRSLQDEVPEVPSTSVKLMLLPFSLEESHPDWLEKERLDRFLHGMIWTFAYRRMPFGLCNAPGTFQRCMMAIFHDMIEKTMEVFMDDFSEKSHFMVKEGIVLGHKISKSGIEVDRAKVEVIAKLPHPTTCKGVPYFLACVLGQRKNKHFQPIHYASKTMTEAQAHYTTTEKELLAVVYAFEKFRSYLVLSKSIVYTDHSAIKYSFAKKDAKRKINAVDLLF
ncbi:retrovirus-related pol polyprotein from transposon 17.6 [Tanacetum coccineum]